MSKPRATNKPATMIRLCTLLLALLFISSCDSNNVEPGEFTDIGEALERWQDRDFDSYTIEQSVLCFCPPPHSFTIEVVADSIVNIDFDDDDLDGWGLSEEELEELAIEKAFTINEVFALITKNLDSAHELNATYDPRYGYPSEVYLDRIKNAVDEEITIRMSNLSFD